MVSDANMSLDARVLQIGHALSDFYHKNEKMIVAASEALAKEQQALVDIFGVEISVSLVSSGEAIRRADVVDLAAMPSPTRRASMFLDAAQAYVQQRDSEGVLAMLNRALRESVDTVRHRPNARQAVVELLDQRGTVGRDARTVALAIGLAD